MAKKPKEPAEPVEVWQGWVPEDGKRFSISLSKPKLPNEFLEVAEADALEEAKKICIEQASLYERRGIVWDRRWSAGIVFEHIPLGFEVKDDKPKPPPSLPTRSGRLKRK